MHIYMNKIIVRQVMNIIYTIVLLRKRQGFADGKGFITVMQQKDCVLQAPGEYLHARLDTFPPDLQSVQCKGAGCHSAAKCQKTFCSHQCGIATYPSPTGTTRCWFESPVPSNRYKGMFHH